MSLSLGTIHQGDCLELLAQMDPGSVDLAFADPPFNIGYKYDVYEDRQSYDGYCAWSQAWMTAVHRVLKPTGTFWLAIGDEFAAELKVIARQKVGFWCRSWVIWYYTFGVNCKKKFNRSHVHLFHFVKDPKKFTFNFMDPAVRVQSARRLVYGDSRAHPDGRMPDDTWILRPQDVPNGFSTDQDTWFFSRVAGTFKERMGFHGCQMPEQLLGRIVRVSSNAGTETTEPDLVLDPFAGSGTTLAVAKKLGRRWIGCELSKEYRKKALARIKSCGEGDLLEGPEDPVTSAPPTPASVLEKIRNGHPVDESVPLKRAKQARGADGSVPHTTDPANAVIEAFSRVHDGFSIDWVLADPELNLAFCSECRRLGFAGTDVECNRLLLRLRKASQFPIHASRTPDLSTEVFERISFACEIAMKRMAIEEKITLDDALSDPTIARQFDEIARGYAPGSSAAQYRWGALRLRKKGHEYRTAAERLPRELLQRKMPRMQDWNALLSRAFAKQPGIYLLWASDRRLYLGDTIDLGRRLRHQYDLRREGSWKAYQIEGAQAFPLSDATHRRGLRARLIRRFNPDLNWRYLSA